MIEEYDLERSDRLIDNAYIALNECEKTGSKWGIGYWSTVLNYLLRAHNRLN